MTDTAGVAAGRSGLGVLDSVQEAVSAVKVVESLNAIRELLRAQAADVSRAAGGVPLDDARATYYTLAALLSVMNSSASKKFDASEWSLTEAESVRIARVFARYDGMGERLDAMQLRKLTAELGQPLNEAEVAVAMSMLDEDGNGVIEFPEFVSWWIGTRRVKAPTAAPATGARAAAEEK